MASHRLGGYHDADAWDAPEINSPRAIKIFSGRALKKEGFSFYLKVTCFLTFPSLLQFWEICFLGVVGNATPPRLSSSCKNIVLKMPTPRALHSRKQMGFEKSQILEQLSDFKSQLSATPHDFLHNWEDGSREVNMNAY